MELKDIENYALEYHIPIMQAEGLEFLLQYIEKHHVKTILEIGAAIGYSAIRMARLHPDIRVVTVERDQERYQEAVNNIKAFGLENQITIYHMDAFDLEIDEQFDFIFIDAAKAQYTKFFEKFKKNLKVGGTILSDNLNFHGLTKEPDAITSKNLRALVRKINAYRDFLQENQEFETKFYDLGDGIAVSIKKG